MWRKRKTSSKNITHDRKDIDRQEMWRKRKTSRQKNAQERESVKEMTQIQGQSKPEQTS